MISQVRNGRFGANHEHTRLKVKRGRRQGQAGLRGLQCCGAQCRHAHVRFSSTSKAADQHGKERGRPPTSQGHGSPVANGTMTSFWAQIDMMKHSLADAALETQVHVAETPDHVGGSASGGVRRREIRASRTSKTWKRKDVGGGR